MTTNQTHIISIVDITPPYGTTISDLVNTFILAAITSGYINFDIKPVVITPEYSGGVPTKFNWHTVQINYYDPSLY